jgi:hypothetical protein
MPIDLTGNSISNVYTSFLHLSSSQLQDTMVSVHDGIGTRTGLNLSTNGVELLGNVSANGLQFPNGPGPVTDILYQATSTQLGFINVLASIEAAIEDTLPNDGTYSSPAVKVTRGIISEIKDNPSIKTFFIRNFNPSIRDYISVITQDWPFPVFNDIAFVRNLANDGLIKLRFTSGDGGAWVIEETI